MSTKVSAVVLTRDEEKNIERCLSSLFWCDEIIIIDDYSQDKTLKKIQTQKAKIKKIKIYQRHLAGDFSAQRNFALKKATGDWVLFVDADEVVSEALAYEIQTQLVGGFLTSQKLTGKEKIQGFSLVRKDFFLGRWLNYGETGNLRLLRIGKRTAGWWEGKVHENWEIKGEVGELQSPLFHFPHPNISEFLVAIGEYTTLVAQSWKEQGRKISGWEIFFFPLGKFCQNYFWKKGFLDGIPGLIMALMMSFHSFLARAKFWHLTKKKNGKVS